MAPFLRPPTWTLALLRGALWLSVLWALLSPACCSRSPPKWRFSTSEIVIPRKVPQRMGKSDMSGHITYSMRFRGQRHVVHMKLKKNMIPQNFPVYTSNDQGAQQKDYPFVPRDCYFYSFLEGVPGSQAILDTCTGGLKGMIQVDDFTYEIKPLASSSKFEHVISLLVVDERSRESKKCRNDEIMAKAGDLSEETKLAGSPRAAPVYLWRYHLKSVGIHYTVTHDLFKQTGSNSSTSVELILIMNSISDSIYKISGLIVYARGVWIWNTKNLHTVPGENPHLDPWSVMAGFGVWKSKELHDLYATTAILLASRPKNTDYGSFQNGLCNPNWGVLFTYVGKNHLFLAGSFLAHAVGHLLDVSHDTPGCVCFRRSSCLMDEFPTLHDMISNCSHNELHRRIHDWDPCLSLELKTAKEVNMYEVPRCGNKRVEASEKCDCGSVKDCTTDKCCEVNCEFTQGSSCAAGGCCLSCKFAPTGTICRDKNGICDLPEYCSGASEHCPGNFYIMDGTPCSPLAVCIAGNCTDRHLQCQALFGYQVKDSSPACYHELNVKGDRFGNCGVRIKRGGSQTVPCQKEDVFCGMLHCDGVKRIVGGGEHTTFYHLKVQDVKEVQCFGYDIHHGLDLPEIGLVMDGATCGPGKYCKNQRCVFHQTLKFNCNISSCNFRGVCNNQGNCHCVQGWQPPKCLQRGKGGSVNSGPITNPLKRYRAKIHVSINKLLIILGARIFLIVALIIFGALAKAVLRPEVPQRPPANS